MRWLLTGGSGLLGHALSRYLIENGHQVSVVVGQHKCLVPGVVSHHMDLSRLDDLQDLLDNSRPDFIVHAAALTNVDACETQPELANFLHAEVACYIASCASKNNSRFIYISTDHLWAGENSFICEDQPVEPINVYAASKAKGEQLVQSVNFDAQLIRTNFFGVGLPWRDSLWSWMKKKLESGETVPAFHDAYFTPTCLPLLSRDIVELASYSVGGVFNLAGSERLSKFDFAMKLAKHIGVESSLVQATSMGEVKLTAERPRDLSLSSRRYQKFLGRMPPTLDEAFAVMDNEKPF
ncbi:SDR family oxidoreductase [Thalassospira lucentensis]|uniref:SDR family oxidoreductase n=1 Tax=Thalassospira lucentensis TaxID=168935 RepID=UPI003D27CEB2